MPAQIKRKIMYGVDEDDDSVDQSVDKKKKRSESSDESETSFKGYQDVNIESEPAQPREN